MEVGAKTKTSAEMGYIIVTQMQLATTHLAHLPVYATPVTSVMVRVVNRRSQWTRLFVETDRTDKLECLTVPGR